MCLKLGPSQRAETNVAKPKTQRIPQQTLPTAIERSKFLLTLHDPDEPLLFAKKIANSNEIPSFAQMKGDGKAQMLSPKTLLACDTVLILRVGRQVVCLVEGGGIPRKDPDLPTTHSHQTQWFD